MTLVLVFVEIVLCIIVVEEIIVVVVIEVLGMMIVIDIVGIIIAFAGGGRSVCRAGSILASVVPHLDHLALYTASGEDCVAILLIVIQVGQILLSADALIIVPNIR